MENTHVKCTNCGASNRINLNNKTFKCIKCENIINSESAYNKAVEALIKFGEDIDKEQNKIMKKYKL